MEDIGDPLGDRVMKNVPQIARFPLKKDEIWHISGKILNIKIEATARQDNNENINVN